MRSLKQAWRNQSLRGKLIISSVFCVLLPLIFSFIMMNRLVQEELVHNSVVQSNETLEVLDIQMTDYFDNLLYLSNYIQFNDSLQAILLHTIERTKQDPTNVDLQALSDIEISRNLEAVTNLLVPSYLSIVIDNGYAYTNYPNVKWNTQSWTEQYAEIIDKPSYGIHWIGVHPNYIEAENREAPYVVSIAGALELTKNHKAFLLLSVREEELRSLMNERIFNTQQEIMLVDANGIVVSHNNQELTQQPFPFYEEMQEGGSHHVVHYNQKEYVMVSQPFTYGEWSIVSLIPQKTAIGNIQKIMRNTLFTIVIFFIIFLLLLILVVSLLTKPLKTLYRVIAQVKIGNLRARSGLTGRGDIEQLGQSWDKMMDTVEQMIEKIKNVEKSKRKAELEMLQAQINPHFLFNTLNSLRLKITLNGDHESSKILQSLSLLLRMTFNRKDEFVTLQNEIEVVRHYIQLMNFKSNSKIELVEDVAQDTLNYNVPCFFLQPLIENSIFHGLQNKNGNITIRSRFVGDGLIIQVADNGKGLSAEALQHLKNELQATSSEVTKQTKSSFTGIGIGNVFQRMRLIYGYQFRMEIENNPSGGTQIMFFIPGHYEV